MTSISAAIRASALSLGFDLVGLAPVQQFRELEYFPQWIAEGRHGEMRYLESRTESGELKRSSIQRAAPWARSVIVTATNYNTDQPYSTEFTDRTRGWISRYAWGQRDYHDVILPKLRKLEEEIRKEVMEDPSAAWLKRLRKNAEKQIPRGQKAARNDKNKGLASAQLKLRPFKALGARIFPQPAKPRPFKEADLRFWSYVDTGPVVERVLAQYAGIGWVGKNTCIINQRLGSWLFLGVILTSLELEPDLPVPDRCGTCTRCLEACPTNAFIEPYKLDASRCISYLTIEKRGTIPEDLREGMGRHVFGCDICQDVCPWNRKAPVTDVPEFQPREGLVSPALEKLATISEEDCRAAFRGSPVKRAKRIGLRRNAIVAIGNSGDRTFLPLLSQLEQDEDPVIAGHATWARKKLER